MLTFLPIFARSHPSVELLIWDIGEPLHIRELIIFFKLILVNSLSKTYFIIHDFRHGHARKSNIQKSFHNNNIIIVTFSPLIHSLRQQQQQQQRLP